MTAPAASSLETRIRDRIARRLGSRIRKLSVNIRGARVELNGECSTYYSKQIAQEIALGVLEDETIANDIVVTIPK